MVATTTIAVPRERWRSALVFVVVGIASVIAGGLVAAVTRPAGWEHGSWVAAYLVLVTGVAQVGFGIGQAILAPNVPTRRQVRIECGLWNLGSAGVIVGTLVTQPVIVSVGSVLLLGALALFALATRGEAPGDPRALMGYRLLLLLLLVSVPVGIVLSWIRA